MSTILVVDDSETDRAHMKHLLRQRGHVVLEAPNGAEGIRLATEKKPDLITMDVVMPEMDGFQATREIATNPDLEHIPIVMCSSKDASTDISWARRQGAAAYLVKPADPIELETLLAKLLQ